jgi:hypothetical protein
MNDKRPLGFPRGRLTNPGDDLLSVEKDYHRPRRLNGPVAIEVADTVAPSGTYVAYSSRSGRNVRRAALRKWST